MSVIEQMREQLVKSGTIDLNKIGIEGKVPEAAARELLDLTVEDDAILKMVNVQRSDEAKIPMDNFDIEDFVLQNIPEGVEPENFTLGQNKGKYIECKPVNAFMRVVYSTIRSAKGNAAVKKFDAKLAKKFGKNLVRVGFQGTNHQDVANTPENINKGWIQILKDSADSHKINANSYKTGGKTDWIEYLAAVVAAMPADYKSEECYIFMNPADYEEYVKQIGRKDGNAAYLINSGVNKFLGYPIVQARYLAAGSVLFTNPMNLLVGLHNDIERQLENKPLARLVNFFFGLSCGYEVGIEDAAVLGFAGEEVESEDPITSGETDDDSGSEEEGEVPANAPADVTFTDTDTTDDTIGGTIAITKATSEDDVTHYAIYFGSDATTKTTEIATLPKTGSDLEFILPDGTAFGDNTHILVFTKNENGLCETPAAVAITDNEGL